MSNEDKILKVLLELAIKRSELIEDVKSQEKNIRNHVIKIMVLVNSERENHWAGEIYGFCDSITTKLKMDNRYPEPSFYMKYLYQKHLETYEEYENVVNNYLRQWEEESNKFYSFYKKDIRTQEDYKKITKFYQEISKLMSKGIVPSSKQVLELLRS